MVYSGGFKVFCSEIFYTKPLGKDPQFDDSLPGICVKEVKLSMLHHASFGPTLFQRCVLAT